MMGLQHTTGPRQLSRLLGWDAVGVTWPVAETWPLAATSQFAGDATCIWVGVVATAATHRGGRGPSRHMISSRTSEFMDLYFYLHLDICDLLWTIVTCSS
jgi:hypothetical protein